MQEGYKSYNGITGSMEDVLPENPTILTRIEKGQALTHIEMDNNLCSLYHTASVVPRSESWEKEKYDEYDKDQYLELKYATLAENIDGTVESHTYPSTSIKLHKSIPEVLNGIANEEVPGNLNISGGLFVTESSKFSNDLRVDGTLSAKKITVDEEIFAPTMSMDYLIVNKSGLINDLSVTKDVEIGEDLLVHNNAGVVGNVLISGSLWVDGTIYGNISSSEYRPSDARLKYFQGPIQSPVEKVNAIHGFDFYWKDSGTKDVGVSAQEVLSILPEAVREGKDEYLEVDYIKIIPLLIEAVKKLSWEVEELKKK